MPLLMFGLVRWWFAIRKAERLLDAVPFDFAASESQMERCWFWHLFLTVGGAADSVLVTALLVWLL